MYAYFVSERKRNRDRISVKINFSYLAASEVILEQIEAKSPLF